MQPTTLTIQPVAYDVQVPTEEAVEQGAPAQGIATIAAGLLVPISVDQSGQPLIVPLANIQFPLDKEHMLRLGNLLIEKAEELPEPKPQSDILVANNLQGIEKQAEELNRFKGQS